MTYNDGNDYERIFNTNSYDDAFDYISKKTIDNN